MSHQALAMSETARSAASTEQRAIESAVQAVHAKIGEYAKLSVAARLSLLRELVPATLGSVDDWIAAACKAKGITPGTATEGEEWLGGPLLMMRNLRLLIETLEQIQSTGAPKPGTGLRTRPDGRVVADVFPASTLDSLLFQGFRAEILFQAGQTEKDVLAKQGSFYKEKSPKGGLSLILGAGNVASIPPMDALYKLFAEGRVCIIKMNPVNEYLGPIFERALAPLIKRDYLRVVYGGGDIGAFLSNHPMVDDIHITGSDRTHDLIVWGPPGPDRERRKMANDPVLKKTITSELGNVSPVLLVPGPYTDAQLAFTATNVASQMTNNASFNCNAAKMLVTAKGWPQKDAFLKLLKEALGKATLRKAYYPGAFDRYKQLTEGRKVERIGSPASDQLPWTLIEGLDSSNPEDPLFSTEPFCSILSHVELPASEPAAFIAAATDFANNTLWGTLNACIIIHPSTEKEPAAAAALDKAILDLEYGTVSVNHWPALGYGFVTTPWGGHPSATLENIQSGIGWVHNTYLFEGIEKGVIRGPLTLFPKPPWFNNHARTHEVAAKMVQMEADPSFAKLPSIVWSAARG